MKTTLDIIQESQDLYSDPRQRAVNIKESDGSESGCVYLNPVNGNMCALGRCMIEPDSADGRYAHGLHEAHEQEGGLDSLLKEEYRGHPLQFWVELQRFHDNMGHFEDGGLSVRGLGYLSELRTKWAS